MTIYEQNLEILEEIRPNLYEALQDGESDENPLQVLVGDALDGEKFLAVIDEDAVIPLSSTYHPSYEAERYTAQFKEQWTITTALIFGFGQIPIIERILSEECPVDKCIVYEPSISIFRKVLEEYDIRDILKNTQMMLLVEGVNDDLLEDILQDHMNYQTWKYFQLVSLSKYRNLFWDSFKKVRDLYTNVRSSNRTNFNTLVEFAKDGLRNEVKAFKWMLECKSIDSMKDKFPKDIPCIMVAAGPSLEKNVDVLRQAKGKAFIICVDRALKFLLERGIVPDMACTVDPRKSADYFTRPEIKEIPMAISTDSNSYALEQIGEFQPIYCTVTNDIAQQMFADRGRKVDDFHGGGSVATVSFKIGVGLGFRTIIIVGQDLAFTDRKDHAGEGDVKEDELTYGLQMVDAYNGGKVMTRGDFKNYIEWYNAYIPKLTDCKVINATEGGAKLEGTIQMSLQEAVDQYCTEECDIKAIIDQAPYVWSTREDKAIVYQELKEQYLAYKGFKRKVEDGIGNTNRAITLLTRGNYQNKELLKIDKKLDIVRKEMARIDGMVLVVKRMIETEVTLNDDLLDAEEDLELESIRLYKKMQTYFQDLLNALEELLPLWKDMMEEINDKYKFE